MKIQEKLVLSAFFITLFFICASASAAQEAVAWNNTKTINSSNVFVVAPQDFTTCSISPDGGDGWDNCTAYVIVTNNFTNVAAANIAFSSSWNRPSIVRSLVMNYTKNITTATENNEIIKYFDDFNSTMPRVDKYESIGIKMTFQKKSWEQAAFNFTSVFSGLVTLELDPTISACGTLDTANAVYTLNTSVNASGTCFTIGAENITLDGAGYTINYSQSATGYAVFNSDWNNAVVKNLNITQGSASSDAYAIYFSGASNATIQNNTIATSGPLGIGIQLNVVSNSSIMNNTITTLSTNGFGISLFSSDSNTVMNNRISTINDYSDGILLFPSSNLNRVINNTISISGNSYGVGLESSSNLNNITDNTITATNANAHGIYIQSSSSNSISGGSITAIKAAYYLQNAGTANNFTNTNFTALRSIKFDDGNSWFNYQNDSLQNIWLKTNPSAAGSINRTLATWSQAMMKWNDTNSTVLTMRYNITGLYPNTPYRIYNTSGGVRTNPYNYTADANGALSFTIKLNGNTEIKAEIYIALTENINPANADPGSLINVSGLAAYSNGTATSNKYINIYLDEQLLAFNFTPAGESSTSWQYRKAITINGSTTLLNDYQILVNLTSSNFNFSRANSEGNDTRFTWLNTTSGLEQNVSFWIENWTSSGADGNATIWVKVPNVTASTVANTTLYIYYGNPAAASISNGTSTFINFAVGGNVTVSNVSRIHSFKGNGTFTPYFSGNIIALVVAGGGGGGQAASQGGGGGGGGLIYHPSFAVTSSSAVSVTIGNGGAVDTNGGNSVFGSLTAVGGGAGRSYNINGNSGGSGGGAGVGPPGGGKTGGAGTQPSQAGDSGTYGFGNNGGNSGANNGYAGGGGGAGGAGGNSPNPVGGVGRNYSSVFGMNFGVNGNFSRGGNGTTPAVPGTGGAGAANTGNGGAGDWNSGDNSRVGGSGIVLVKYVFKQYASPEPSVLSIGAEQTAAITTNSTGGYNFTFTAPLSIGSYILKINLTDANGIYGENSTNFTVYEAVPPTITISEPVQNSHYKGILAITTDISDVNGISYAYYNISNMSGLAATGNLNATDNWDASFNTTAKPDGNYTLIVWANDTAGNSNNQSVNFTIDNLNPQITWNNPLPDNTSIYNGAFSLNITFSDSNLFKTLINITDSSGNELYFNKTDDVNITSQTYTDLISGLPNGNYTIEASATDDHTDTITDLKKGKKGEEQIIFNSTTSETNITAYFVEKLDKLTDTPGDFKSGISDLTAGGFYKFAYNFTAIKPETKLVLNITSTKPLIYRTPVSGINGHFVWDNYYIDFNDVPDTMDVSVSKIGDYAYQVKIQGKTQWAGGQFIEIDPVAGGLNTVTEYKTFEIDLPPAIIVQSPQNITYTTQLIWFNITGNEVLNWSAYSLDGAANVSMDNTTGNWNKLNSTMAFGHHAVQHFANDSFGNVNSSQIIYFTVENITITETLTPSTASPGQTVSVSGRAMRQSDGTVVSNNSINVYLGGQQLVCGLSITSGCGNFTPAGESQALWQYRKAITINGSTANLSDYQVLVNLTASNFNFSRANSEGNDTRFTWLNTTSGLEQNVSFWIENWTSSGANGNATIWVKVPNVTASTVANTTLYMYYGNPSATYNASLAGYNTFLAFNDGTSLLGWNSNGATISGGTIVLAASGTGQNYLTSQNLITRPVIAQYDVTIPGYYAMHGFFVLAATQEPDVPSERYVAWYDAGDNIRYTVLYDGVGTQSYVDAGARSNSMKTLKIIWDETRAGTKYYINGAQKTTPAAKFPSDTQLYFSISDYSGNTAPEITIDNVRVRKYASVEPSVLSIGAEHNTNTTTNSAGEYNFTFTAPESGGNYIVKANLTSPEGIVGSNETNLTVTEIDSTPPAITIQSPQNRSYSTQSIWFNITGNEAMNWSAYSLDGSENITLENSSGNWWAQNTSMAEGFHTAVFWANDSAGNMNSTEISFNIDRTEPLITIQSPINTTYATSTIDFNITGSEILNWSGYALDGAEDIVSMANESGKWWAQNTSMADGSHTVVFWANDSAGNVNSTSITFAVNTAVPLIWFEDPTPANNSNFGMNWAYINTTVSDYSSPNNLTAFIDWDNSLAGWWRFNLEAGENDTHARDWSSWENNGTLTNMNPGLDNCTGNCSGWTTSGKFGKALKFDGADDYVAISNSPPLSINTSFSVSAWVYANELPLSRNMAIIRKGSSSIQTNYFLISSMGMPSFFMGNGSTTFEAIGTASDWAAGSWNYIAGIYNSTHINLFMNGLLINSTPFAGVPATTTDVIHIGDNTISGARWNGTIDEVRIFSRALSEEEINASYNAGIYRPYHNFTDLTNGTYTYAAYVQNLNGNTTQTETRTVTIGNSSYLEVNLSEPDTGAPINAVQNNVFLVNATVVCRQGNCGNIAGTVQYNKTADYPDTAINETSGAEPFYINETPAASTKSCGNNPLSEGDFCNIAWLVNATGAELSSWKIGVNFSSDAAGVPDNSTSNATVDIIPCFVDITVGWASIDFENPLVPNTNQNPALGNGNQLYNITINPGSCSTDIYVKGTNMENSTLGSSIGAGNLTWSNTSNDYASSYSMAIAYNPLMLNIPQNTNITTWYWINVPPVYTAAYNGTVYIQGVKNGDAPP